MMDKLNLDETLKDIRQKCRLAMDGIKSSSMRMKGLDYKLNFGLVLQQIKDIAEQYEKNAELADRLWSEETRELIILSTHLYPISEFSVEKANNWVKTIPNQEIREQVCINLFQELSYANQIAIDWANEEDLEIRKTGYWLLARLLLTRKFDGTMEIEYFKNILDDIISEDIFLRNASLLSLKHIGRQSKEDADMVLTKVLKYKDHPEMIKQEAYNALAFEFEYTWG